MGLCALTKGVGRLHTFIWSGGTRALVGARLRQRREGRVVVRIWIVALTQLVGFAGKLLWHRELWRSAHLTIAEVRVRGHDRPLGRLWVRQLGGLVYGGVDGASEGIARMGHRPMRRVPRVMR